MAPEAETLKVTLVPEHTVWLAGCVLMVGPEPANMIKLISLVNVMLPDTPVTVIT